MLCWIVRAGGGGGAGRLEARLEVRLEVRLEDRLEDMLTALCFVVTELEGFVVIGSSTGGPGLRGGGGVAAVT